MNEEILIDKKDIETETKKQKNKKFKIILIITIILVCCSILVFSVFAINKYRQEQEQERIINEFIVLLNEGNNLIDAGDYREAIEIYKKVIELQPNNSSGYVGLSNAYRLSGDETNARLTLEKGYIKTGDKSLF